MDLSYDFAASIFMPVLRKIITVCLRLNNPNGIERKIVTTSPPAISSSTCAKQKEGNIFLNKLLNPKDDKELINQCMQKAFELTQALVNTTRKQHSYAFEKSSSNYSAESPAALPESNDETESGNNLEQGSMTTETAAVAKYLPHVRLVEEVFLLPWFHLLLIL